MFNLILISKIRYPMFWMSKLPQLVKETSPIVFSRMGYPSSIKPRRLESMGSRLTRSISQVSNLSKPTRSLKRSFSIVSNNSVSNLRQSSRNSRSRSGSQRGPNGTLTVPLPNRTIRRLKSWSRLRDLNICFVIASEDWLHPERGFYLVLPVEN